MKKFRFVYEQYADSKTGFIENLIDNIKYGDVVEIDTLFECDRCGELENNDE